MLGPQSFLWRQAVSLLGAAPSSQITCASRRSPRTSSARTAPWTSSLVSRWAAPSARRGCSVSKMPATRPACAVCRRRTGQTAQLPFFIAPFPSAGREGRVSLRSGEALIKRAHTPLPSSAPPDRDARPERDGCVRPPAVRLFTGFRRSRSPQPFQHRPRVCVAFLLMAARSGAVRDACL